MASVDASVVLTGLEFIALLLNSVCISMVDNEFVTMILYVGNTKRSCTGACFQNT